MKHRIEFLEAETQSPESTSSVEKSLFLMFHGFGADAYDLRSLSEVLRGPGKSTHWIFPQGVHSVPIGPGWTGRAWWPLSVQQFEKDAAQGNFTWTEIEPPGLPDLRKSLMEWIEKLEGDWGKIVLGGFSQGAMLACDLFLHAPKAPLGLVMLSGTLINRPDWSGIVGQRKGSRFFQSHGRQDPVLPFKAAARLETFLTQNGMKGSLFAFDGTHEIPMEVIAKANQYLTDI